MRVTDYELFEVPPRWQFLKIETSDGLVGWGEPYTKWHIEDGSTPATRTAVTEMMEKYVVGEDPSRIEDHWSAMYRASFYRGGPVHMSAIAGIDEALWDLKGKRYGAPVYTLLGGRVRDRVRLYQHVGGEDPESMATSAENAVEQGFTALKVTPTDELQRVDSPATIEPIGRRVGAIREAVGPEIDIGVDLHGRVSKAMGARVANALEPHNPMFIEEAVTPEYDDALPALADATEIPIATGERLYTRTDFKPRFESGALDVAQPDVSHAGGITESKKIADIAEAYDVAIAPHCPIGPLALASSIQIDTCSPNALVQEQTLHVKEGWRRYLENDDAFDHDEGYVDPPTEPGLGVSIDERAVRAATEEEFSYARPVWRHDDGSVAER